MKSEDKRLLENMDGRWDYQRSYASILKLYIDPYAPSKIITSKNRNQSTNKGFWLKDV